MNRLKRVAVGVENPSRNDAVGVTFRFKPESRCAVPMEVVVPGRPGAGEPYSALA
jgi:hypothetical protein